MTYQIYSTSRIIIHQDIIGQIETENEDVFHYSNFILIQV